MTWMLYSFSGSNGQTIVHELSRNMLSKSLSCVKTGITVDTEGKRGYSSFSQRKEVVLHRTCGASWAIFDRSDSSMETSCAGRCWLPTEMELEGVWKQSSAVDGDGSRKEASVVDGDGKYKKALVEIACAGSR